MKIAVVGTSNSIGSKGYTRSMAQGGLVSRFNNFSLGHSTSVVLPFSLSRFDPDTYDFCIFDFAVNEDSLIKNNPEKSKDIQDRLAYILEKFSNSPCIPVMLIMPCYIGLDNGSITRKIYTDFALEHGLPYFDGYSFLDRLCIGANFSREDLFRDPDHMASWAAYALGVAFAEQLNQLLKRRVRPHAVDMPVHEFGYVHLSQAESTPGPIVERRNSLVSATFKKFTGSASVQVTLDSPADLIGIGIDLGASNTKLRLSSGGKAVNLDFGMNYYDPSDEKVVFVVRPIIPFLHVEKEFSIEFIGRGGEDNLANLLHGFSLRMPKRVVKAQRIRGIHEDLVGLIEDNYIKIANYTARAFLQK